ncbi:PHP domain-containing protein [Clostridium sp. MB40-C1]|uniref:PHP domain-containing protein n=1 Tax=Clostridium sp. MB40-C1 TaxID=3070996 RepID=UPI0027DF274F|nr:PHP domain-containing protein [Clostridium sp. MB40-C1]WMJ79090.1 PHP domain-containing protein [Clostridium sp. MB40-C1]
MTLDENIKVDLHIHSNASDGTYSPNDIVYESMKKQLGLISLTDHDEVKNIEITKKIAKENGIKFLPGIEVSSTLKGELFHVLAYGTDNFNKQLLDLLEHNRYILEKKDDDSIRYLIDKGYEIDYFKYKKYKYDNSRGGWKALNFLIDENLCKDVKDYFTRLFNEKGGFEFPEFPHTSEVIKIIKKSEGVPVLAHPYYGKDDTPVKEKLDKFLRLGIEGVECFHPNHNIEKSEMCYKWCVKNRLIVTSGSDFHGGFIEERNMGKPEMKLKDIRLGKLIDYI